MSNVARNGKVHVCARRCDTCIFRPGNLMNLEPGRVEQMWNDTKDEGHIPCHDTLDDEDQLICRGFWDRAISHGHSMLQIADRLGMTVMVDL